MPKLMPALSLAVSAALLMGCSSNYSRDMLTLASLDPLAATQPAATKPAIALTPEARLIQQGNVGKPIHDPSTIVECNGTYYIYYTGRDTPSYTSKDLIHWDRGPSVFTTTPSWIAATVPANNGSDFWAPDIYHLKDKYLLYYAVSTFGKPVSGIGLATNSTLDPKDPKFKWVDQGLVIQSTTTSGFNAIDPAITQDADGGLWMCFGSFWSGIRLIQLDPATGKRLKPDSTVYTLAHTNAIEASYIYHHDQYYYLFVNWGQCCKGVNSTYNIRIGRSEKITGPYLDKTGKDMRDGGGSLVLQTDGNFIGPGHAGIITKDKQEYMSMHFYDGTKRGASELAIRPVTWDDKNWPVVGEVKPPTPAAKP